MNLSQFVLILQAHLRVILLILSITVLVALGISLTQSKQYKATSSVVLNYKASDPVTGLVVAPQALPGFMPTQVAIINSPSVALAVVDNLKLAQQPAVKAAFDAQNHGDMDIRNWLAGVLLAKLDAVASKESSVIDITFRADDPQFAALVANAFAAAYQQVSMQLKLDPTRKASSYFNDQTKLLRDAYEQAQAKLSKYQEEHGITNLDTRTDVENNRLNDLSTQLVMAQSALAEAQSRSRQAKAGGAAESPDVNASGLIQTLKSNLAISEARFEQASKRLGVNHPDYLAAKAERDGLRAQLANASAAISASVGGNATILAKRESEIRADFEAQKRKVLEMNRTRDELAVLSRELESAQRAYEMTSQRFAQTSLEGQSNQSDISLLSAAVPPVNPSSPRILINLILAMFVGGILGVMTALGLELTNRRVRSEQDLVEELGLPVLGSITRPVTSSSRRRFGFGRGKPA
ncbi:chain length determinant protein EpsF [Herbaspirillum sp. WGmk3]|uniref:chain length determinant protein EpsF n=1 Tax=Herbaspirillum sp. WGmk3 TaxID=2919925 RepID=UPI0020916D83|nr:chain length determinant protein EpsF [Herbaspirillum sp. WGmk3]MCO4856850.1 chain length determinant protein EpsF [Herbaspirillum sp. WGmk3]